MYVFSVHQDGPGQIGRPAVRFRVEEIAPTADGLAKRDHREDEVQEIPDIHLMVTADEDRGNNAEDQPAVDRQAAAADIEHGPDIARVHVPFKDDVIDPGADDRSRDHEDAKIENVIRI